MTDETLDAKEHRSGHEGTMDLTEHMKTWLAFRAGVKWSAAGLLLVAIFLAIFRTHN